MPVEIYMCIFKKSAISTAQTFNSPSHFKNISPILNRILAKLQKLSDKIALRITAGFKITSFIYLTSFSKQLLYGGRNCNLQSLLFRSKSVICLYGLQFPTFFFSLHDGKVVVSKLGSTPLLLPFSYIQLLQLKYLGMKFTSAKQLQLLCQQL